jgi:uncharacterized protein YdeI (YjbR/CyaY-like superfamily)
MKKLYVKTRAAWRRWLAANHEKVTEIWLLCYRKGTGKPTLDYEAAVEEALCFGWIDSIIKKIDDTRFVRRFTPRKANSVWSESNKKRIARMIKAGRMAECGLAKVDAAKRSGRWSAAKRPVIPTRMPEAFARALERNKKARSFFQSLAPTYQRHYIAWISFAKREETRKKRIRESISLLAQGEKLGLR